ncbi:hypothetical protein [Microbacterium resistens]|uniref:hypothetical protein n=1 Tax=Microbacterium resistens TaxID=156977 RepID=UPI00366CD9E0
MNIEQTNQLLIRIQVLDNRQVGDSTVLAWHELVGRLDYETAVEAVKLHFGDPSKAGVYLTPAHVLANAERIRFAALGPVEDEWGNLVDPEPAALEAAQRLAADRKAVER